MPNYNLIKNCILVIYTTIASSSLDDYKPEDSAIWARAISRNLASIQYLPEEAVQEVLELAMTCTSEETQTYQFMQIGDGQLKEIMDRYTV